LLYLLEGKSKFLGHQLLIILPADDGFLLPLEMILQLKSTPKNQLFSSEGTDFNVMLWVGKIIADNFQAPCSYFLILKVLVDDGKNLHSGFFVG
jgi:hypothetical protein